MSKDRNLSTVNVHSR